MRRMSLPMAMEHAKKMVNGESIGRQSRIQIHLTDAFTVFCYIQIQPRLQF